MLARTLAGGAAPLLRAFDIEGMTLVEQDMDSLAAMLEARANISGCEGLDSFDVNDDWFEDASLATAARILRTLLPSVNNIPFLFWHHAFEPCFRDIQAPFLTAFEVTLDPGEDGFSWRVFEALLAVQSIMVRSNGKGAVLQSMAEALRRGFLQSLQEFELRNCTVGAGAARDFSDALERSGCATRWALYVSAIAKWDSRPCAPWQSFWVEMPCRR